MQDGFSFHLIIMEGKSALFLINPHAPWSATKYENDTFLKSPFCKGGYRGFSTDSAKSPHPLLEKGGYIKKFIFRF